MHDAPDPTSNSNSQIPFDKDRSELTPLYSNAADTGTLKLIIGFFFGFSVTLTLALSVQLYYGKTQITPHGSVTCDSEICSNIGVSILKQGGNAVDAAIASAFCLGVVNPHITGIGGGGFMLIYSHRDRKVLDTIDFRVTRSNDTGIGVPGFVAGLYLAHQLHGVLPWNALISPSHYIAFMGFQVSQTLLDSKEYLLHNMPHNENLKEWLEPLTQVNEVINNIDLAKTLATIAASGPTGKVTVIDLIGDMVTELYSTILPDEIGSIVDVKDIREYKAIQSSSMKSTFHNYDIFVPSQGSGGPLLLKNLKYVNESYSPLISAVEGYFHVAEGWPVSLASHIATTDVNDLYVSVVSGLGWVLGSQVLTPSGFILNNILEITLDESQRPDVLWTPAIAVQSGKVCGRRLIFGGGDVRDVAQALVQLLRYPTTATVITPEANLTQIVDAPRVRIIAPKIAIEKPTRISNEDYIVLSNFTKIDAPLPYPSINVIEKIKDTTVAVADFRGNGSSASF